MNKLIIVGSAPCVFEDFDCCPKSDSDYMALNFTTAFISMRIKYVATYHPFDGTILSDIKASREKVGGNTDYKVIAHLAGPGVDIVEPFSEPSGSSCLLGALACIGLGYKKIILCGCPLTGKVKTDGCEIVDSLIDYERFRKGWLAAESRVKDYVRSMSGWTREFLGEPSKEWLREF